MNPKNLVPRKGVKGLTFFDPKTPDPGGELAYLANIVVGVFATFNAVETVLPQMVVIVPSVLSFITIFIKVCRDQYRKRLRKENAELRREIRELRENFIQLSKSLTPPAENHPG